MVKGPNGLLIVSYDFDFVGGVNKECEFVEEWLWWV